MKMKKLGTESNFLRNAIDMQPLIKEIALCPEWHLVKE